MKGGFPMILYRPVRQAEYDLIAASGFTAFPPLHPEMPLFHPTLDEQYARKYNEMLNRLEKAAGRTSCITMFEVDDEYAARLPMQIIGAQNYRELWVPAYQLEEFNTHIIGQIRVL